MSVVGYSWLVEHLGLPERPMYVRSRLGTRMRTNQGADGSTQNEYPPQYKPEATVIGHLEFALKHEGIDLALLREIFLACGSAPIESAVQAKPTSRYSRLMGFYYELSTGQNVNLAAKIGGNYVNALSVKDYLVSPKPHRNRRWRVNDNHLGDSSFCPIVRLTPEIKDGFLSPLQSELKELVDSFPPELFQRASDYLYLKETKSSYNLESEPMPPGDRVHRFVALLRSAGEGDLGKILSEPVLVERQNLIVDKRYADRAFRSSQNYVGEQHQDFSQKVHYVCPPPELVHSLMAGLANSAERSAGTPAIARAAIVAFGFVFIHPFEDGNGRLHRYLIHDVLHRDGFIGPRIMLPVSATMLQRRGEYDAALERYSRPLMEAWVKFDIDGEGKLTVTNPSSVEGYYRFPDMTPQVEYLITTVALTIREEFAPELRYLRGYDTARKMVQAIVDMPDRHLDLLLRFLHQNQGRLAKARRNDFQEVTDDELNKIEAAFAECFGLTK